MGTILIVFHHGNEESLRQDSRDKFSSDDEIFWFSSYSYKTGLKKKEIKIAISAFLL